MVKFRFEAVAGLFLGARSLVSKSEVFSWTMDRSCNTVLELKFMIAVCDKRPKGCEVVRVLNSNMLGQGLSASPDVFPAGQLGSA